LYPSICYCFPNKPRYLLPCGCLPIPQWIRHTLLFAVLLMSTNPAMDMTYFVKLNSQFVLHS